MKKIFFLIILLLINSNLLYPQKANVINDIISNQLMIQYFTPSAKGFMFPEFNNLQRNGLYPPSRFIIYNSSSRKFEYYNRANWKKFNLHEAKVPTLSTIQITDISATKAISGGTITSDGGLPITARGICWSTHANPTIADSITSDSIGVGNFSSRIKGLMGNTIYFIRAYATNRKGTGYGNEVSFKTPPYNLICTYGVDTVTLKIEDYYNRGDVEWQASIDSINWNTIHGEVNDTYRFIPTQTQFYRALIKTTQYETQPSTIIMVKLGPLLNYPTTEGDVFNNGKLAITFDDGWESIYTTAFPLFVSHNVRFTLYVITDKVGSTGFCTWAQLREMHEAGFDIQCHTQTHTHLTTLTDEQIAAEMLAVDAAFIANGLPKPDHCAYPVGDYNDRVLNVIDDYRQTGRRTVGYPTPSLIDRKSNKFKLDSFFIGQPITDSFMTTLKDAIMSAQSGKLAMTIFGHKVGDGFDNLSTPASRIEELIVYAKSIGIDITTVKHIYSQMFYLDLRLERSVDNIINVHLTSQLDKSVSIERSTDGVNFVEVKVLTPGERLYSDTGLTLNTAYYYRAKSEGLPYSRIAPANTTNVFTLTPTGDGSGISRITFRAAETITLTLAGGAKFYTDASATLNESSEMVIVPLERGHLITRYIRCTTESQLKIPENTIHSWAEWVSATNAASIGGDISKMTALTYIYINGINSLSGSIEYLTLAQIIYIIQSSGLITYPRFINHKSLSSVYVGPTILTSANVNQLLADMWANRDEPKPITDRIIDLSGKFGTGAPTGQGLIDKAALQAYRSPNNDPTKAIWVVTTR